MFGVRARERGWDWLPSCPGARGGCERTNSEHHLPEGRDLKPDRLTDMRLVFAGTPSITVPFLNALAESRHELVAVVTRPDAAQGRSKRLVPSPAAQWAQDHAIPVLKPSHPRDPDFIDALRDLAPDCCPVVAYGALLPRTVLAVPPHGWVNVHFSLLPRWRGAAPVQRAIMAGDAESGITIFEVTYELDSGPVYSRWSEPLRPDDTSGVVLDRYAQRGADLLVDVMDCIAAGTCTPQAQPDEGVTLAAKLTSPEVQLDWTQPAAVLDRVIRGANPSPMAWTSWLGQRFRVCLARPTNTATLTPRELRIERARVCVGTGAGDLELVTVQPVGRNPMPAIDWARGVRQLDPRFDL